VVRVFVAMTHDKGFVGCVTVYMVFVAGVIAMIGVLVLYVYPGTMFDVKSNYVNFPPNPGASYVLFGVWEGPTIYGRIRIDNSSSARGIADTFILPTPPPGEGPTFVTLRTRYSY
jgi:hypothetical protein